MWYFVVFFSPSVVPRQRKTLVTMATLLLVRDSVGSLQIWGMFLFGPSPHVIDFDDVSSQYEGKYIVL